VSRGSRRSQLPKEGRKNQFKRQTLFPACYYCNFTKSISAIVMEARNKNNVKYLRPLMLHHKFPNILELFQSNLNKKVMHGLISLDFEKRYCNCTKALKNEDGKCIFNGKCHSTTVICRVTCTTCAENEQPMYYIGSMQNAVKECCAYQHADNVCRLVNQDAQSDSFASHFAKHFMDNQGVKHSNACKHMSVDILWKGNTITCQKPMRPTTASCAWRRDVQF